jgi:hypothetical protein
MQFVLGFKLKPEDTTNLQRPNPYILLIYSWEICLSKGFIDQ